jgi:hypothetical protein
MGSIVPQHSGGVADRRAGDRNARFSEWDFNIAVYQYVTA